MILFDPKGFIAGQERDLILTAAGLMAVIVVPVLVLAAVVAFRYRAKNKKAAYVPEWDHNLLDEFIWWLLPCIIIVALGIITWKSTHELDPYRPLAAVAAKPITVQVVALDWKWLFIYPEEGIATVNMVEFPEKTPVNFEITADAPMNSFWIPQLGGQIYAMSGMSTRLHLIANEAGDYGGLSANFSGKGFAGMKFTARVVSPEAYADWIARTRASQDVLTEDLYKTLAAPSENNPPAYFGGVDPQLYNKIIAQYQ